MRRCWGQGTPFPHFPKHYMILGFPWLCWHDIVVWQHTDVISGSTISQMWVKYGAGILGFPVLKKTQSSLNTWPASINFVHLDKISLLATPVWTMKYALQQSNRFFMISSQIILIVRSNKNSFHESYGRCIKQNTGAWQKSSSTFTTNLSYY